MPETPPNQEYGTPVKQCGNKTKPVKLTVTAREGHRGVEGIAISVTDAAGKVQKITTDADGYGHIEVARGEVTATTTLETDLLKKYEPPRVTKVRARSVQTSAILIVKLQPLKKLIRPAMTGEKLKVLFNPKTSECEVVYVEMTLSENHPDVPSNATGVLTRSSPQVKAYTDTGCTAEVTFTDQVASIPADKLTAPLRYYLKAGAAVDANLTFGAKLAEPNPNFTIGHSPPVRVMFYTPETTAAVSKVAADFMQGGTRKLDIEVTLRDKETVLTEAVLEILDKDDAVVCEAKKFAFPADAQDTGVYTVQWDGKATDGTYVALDKSPVQVRITSKDKYDRVKTDKKPVTLLQERHYLALSFADPEAVNRAFPKDFPVTVLYQDATKVECKVGEKGVLLDPDGKPGVKVDTAKLAYTLQFKGQEGFFVCEPRGQTVADTVVVAADKIDAWIADPDVKKLGARAFSLPKADWELKTHLWGAPVAHPAWKEPTSQFAVVRGETPGTDAAPFSVLLSPAWQFTRFTYQDRFRGGTEQVSILPIMIDGHLTAPPSATTVPHVRSNWTLGDTPEATVQCLPWLGKTLALAATSELRWKTAANTFIETPADKSLPRKLSVGTAYDAPNATRLRFYDLPVEWRSTNYYARKSAKGTESTGGAFYYDLTPTKMAATRDAPLVFSLDDVVFYNAFPPNAASPKRLAMLALSEPVTVFKNDFTGGTNLSDEGVYRPAATAAPRDGEAQNTVRFPASVADILKRGGAVTTDKVKENYLFEYPDWVRAVIVGGNVYDVFSARSLADPGEADRVVGARAAMCYLDTSAPIPGVSPTGGTGATAAPVPGNYITPRPAPLAKPFLVQQPYVEIEGPASNARRDSATSSGKGTTSVKTGPFKHARVGRAVDKHQEWSAEGPRARTIGRVGMVLLRCCGVDADDPTRELAINLHYFRLAVAFGTTSTNNTAPLQQAWLKNNTTNLMKRWNGPDGARNPGRAWIEQRDKKELIVQIVRFFQFVPITIADLRFDVIGAAGGRDYMNSVQGITQSTDGNEGVESNGTFTSGHEMGHAGGILDDYCELWNHASYYQPATGMLVPGDPYIDDNVPGKESMMLGNVEVRGRHFWHAAEWVRAQLPTAVDLQILHGDGLRKDLKPYFLPHHQQNRKPGRSGYRSFLSYPYAEALDASDPAKPTEKARYDAYLYPLGEDVYSGTILPSRAGATEKYDGLLIIAVHIGIETVALVDHDLVRGAATATVTALRKAFNHRVYADVEVGPTKLKRCLIHISPRILVSTYAGDKDYNALCKIDEDKLSTAWAPGVAVTAGNLVHPSGGENGWCYEIKNINDPGVGSSWLGGTVEPTWPTSDGGVVVDSGGNVSFTAKKKPAAVKGKYDALIEDKCKTNQLHLVLSIGAGTTEIVSPVGQIPHLNVVTPALLQVWKSVQALADLVATVQASGLTKAANEYKRLAAEIKSIKEAKVLRAQEIVTMQAGVVTQEQIITNLDLEMSAMWALNPAKLVKNIQRGLAVSERDRLAQAILDHQRLNSEGDTRLTTVLTPALTAVELAHGKVATATCMADVLDKTKAMLATYFTGPQPMGNPSWTAADSRMTLVDTESKRSGATVATTIAKLDGATEAPVLALKAGMALICPYVSPQEVASIGKAMHNVAAKIRVYAAEGSDDPGKLKCANAGVKAVTALQAAAVQSRDKWVPLYRAARTLDFSLEKNLSSIDREAAYHMPKDLGTVVGEKGGKSLNEQLKTLFATWLGVSLDPTKTDGYKALVQSVAAADKITVGLIKPPPVPVVIVQPQIGPVLQPPPTSSTLPVVVI